MSAGRPRRRRGGASPAEGLYRLGLRVYPRRFRRLHGDAMTATFRQLLRQRRREGTLATLRFLADTAWDLLRNGLAERRDLHRSPLATAMHDLPADLRLALRGLRLRPGFAAVTLLTLGLGIGANAVVFSFVDAILLRPLPYPDAERLVMVREVGEEGRRMAPSYLNFRDWRDRAEGLEGLAAMSFAAEAPVTGGVEPVQARAVGVTRGFFETIGVAPLRGRFTVDEEHRPGSRAATVISHGFWQRALGGADLDGLTLQSRGLLLEVVGVMPPGFRVLDDADLWYPFEIAGNEGVRGAHFLRVIGRLAPAATAASLDAELDGIAAAIRDEHGDDSSAVEVEITPLRREVTGDVRAPLLLLLGAGALVLLVACSNLASTLLARGAARREELAVRASLGGGRGRILRQLLVEALVLATLGAGAGALLAAAGVQALVALGPPLPRIAEVGVDLRVLGFSALLALASTLLFGLVPALRLSTTNPAGALRGGGAAGRTTADGRAWRLLVAGEVALTVALLFGAGLLLGSLWNIVEADVGYDPEGVLLAEVALPAFGERTPSLYEALLREARSLPGVEAAGLGSLLPLARGSYTGPFQYDDGRRAEAFAAGYRVTTPGWFEALGIPLVRGRLFDSGDGADAPHVVVVNESMARRYFPGEDPVGRRIRAPGMDAYGDAWLTIVGVVGEARHWAAEPGEQPEYYVSLAQRPRYPGGEVVMALRSTDPEGLAPGPALRDRRRRPGHPDRRAPDRRAHRPGRHLAPHPPGHPAGPGADAAGGLRPPGATVPGSAATPAAGRPPSPSRTTARRRPGCRWPAAPGGGRSSCRRSPSRWSPSRR